MDGARSSIAKTASGVAGSAGVAVSGGGAEEAARRAPSWREVALIVASWCVLVAFIFVPAAQILGLMLVPIAAALLARSGHRA
jgi:hypothetical protein